MYTDKNFKTKKALRQALANGEKILVYQPEPFGHSLEATGKLMVCIEGPHYPAPHTWYATVEVIYGIITKVKG